MTVHDLREATDDEVEHAIDMVIEEKDPRAEWDNEEMRMALSRLADGSSYSEVMEDVDGTSQGTVNTQVEYASEHLPEDDGGSAYEVDDEPPAPGESASSEFVDPAERAASKFRGFLEEMQDKVGLKDEFIESVVYDVQTSTGALPDPGKLGDRIDMGQSGVSNGQQIRWVCNHYREWLNRYAETVSPSVAAQTTPPSMNGSRQQPNQQSGWHSPGDSRQQHGGPSGPQGGQMGGQPQDPRMMQVMEMQKEMLEQMKQMNQSSPSNPASDLRSQVQQFAEMKEALDALEGSDEDNKLARAVQKELRDLRSQVGQNQGQQVQADNPVQSVLLQAAQEGDRDVAEIAELVDKLGNENDPKVVEKKLEKDMKEQELQHKRERTEKTMKAVQEIIGSVANEVSSAIQQREAAQQQAGQQQDIQRQVSQMSADGRGATGAGMAAGSPGSSTPTREDGGSSMTVTDGEGEEENNTVSCPNCGHEQESRDDSPGFECVECDYSVDVCPECASTVEIQPPDKHDQYECPECQFPATPELAEDGEISCSECDWEGDVEESPGQVVQCRGCGLVSAIRRGVMEGGA